jgi:dihydrofolate reductase
MKIAIIAAIDEENGIGRNNQLLCHLPADIRRFKQLTTGHTVIMGRKTFDSLPNGALPNRKNIVLTRDMKFIAENVDIIHSIEEVLELCKDQEQVFIIGGGEIYKLFMQYADILFITRIHHRFHADAFFPEIDPEIWMEETKSDRIADEKHKFNFSFIDYIKKPNIHSPN